MKKSLKHLRKSFFNIEHSVVDRYTKIEDTFVETYLAKEGETTAEAKERLLQERAQRERAQRKG